MSSQVVYIGLLSACALAALHGFPQDFALLVRSAASRSTKHVREVAPTDSQVNEH
ncbi:hypothetical protein FA15DRAFT_669659 [Coprinopsis marcescibilis]|uniref:Uncharacterized protein n=1 Tax=Coprinopsis marcescibilis TaxID=230819 RepID=A0A5C3KVF6_COPMA|nr:hypothetical protein FA15DRAFT_669659 [Coprinopsis marcescibilis]